jgi:hypothetical protein
MWTHHPLAHPSMVRAGIALARVKVEVEPSANSAEPRREIRSIILRRTGVFYFPY